MTPSNAVPRSRCRHVVALALVAVMAAAAAGCTSMQDPEETTIVEAAPQRFTIVPDDYHVPYAGTAEDGRRFFLSEELFEEESYVGLFLWKADGTFDEVRVDAVARDESLPPGQAGPAGAEELVEARLAELGDYKLGPIKVEPFTKVVDGVTFGWELGEYDDGSHYIGVVPGDFIVYYAPWDGLEYDT